MTYNHLIDNDGKALEVRLLVSPVETERLAGRLGDARGLFERALVLAKNA